MLTLPDASFELLETMRLEAGVVIRLAMHQQDWLIDFVRVVKRRHLAVDIGNLIVPREPFVEERVVRRQQLQHAAVLLQLAPDEQVGLLLHGLTQVLVEVRELVDIGDDACQLSELQPLIGKVIDERPRASVADHPPHLPIQDGRIFELSPNGKIEKLVVRNAAPQKEREP